MKKVIIIGAGIGGLISAIKLKHHGYDVTVIEKNGYIGGKINQIKKDGFTFNIGPMTDKYYEIFDDVYHYVGKDPREYFSIFPLSKNYHVYFSKENMAEVSSEFVSLNKFLETLNEKEISHYFSFLDEHFDSYTSKDNFIKKSFNPMINAIKSKVSLNQLNHFKSRSLNPSESDFTISKHLRELLIFQQLFLGGSSYDRNYRQYFSPNYSDHEDMVLIKGGMSGYIQGLEKLMQEVKIKILTNTHVDEIFISQGHAKGVVIGEDIFCADIVINNTDFPYAMTNLIKNEKHRPRNTSKKLEKMYYSPSAFMMALGLNIKLNQLNVHNLYLSSDLDANINSIFNAALPTSPSMVLHVPSKIDSNLAPLNHEVLIIFVPVPHLKEFKQSRNDKLIQQFRQIVLDRIATGKFIDNLEEHIISETILTPKDWERNVHAHYGSIFGLSSTSKQSKHSKPEPKSKEVQRLYHTGTSIVPGATIPLVMVNAQLYVDEVLKFDPNGEGNACSIYAKQYENA